MLTLLIWTFVALAAAAAVLVVASVAGGRTGDLGAFGRDLTAAVRRLRADADPAGARPGTAPQPVDASIDELLRSAEVDDPAYLAAEDLTDTLVRARERASRGVAGLTRR